MPSQLQIAKNILKGIEGKGFDKAELLEICKRNRISLSGYIRQKLFS